MGGLANATQTLHRLNSLRYWDLGPKPLVWHWSCLADALIPLAHRAGIARPRAEGDELSGVTSDRESFAFISGAAGLVGGLPLRRAMNPWAMPEAST